MRLSLVCVLFDPAIPTSFFNCFYSDRGNFSYRQLQYMLDVAATLPPLHKRFLATTLYMIYDAQCHVYVGTLYNHGLIQCVYIYI